MSQALLTIKGGNLIANAGIDQKNAGRGLVALWPRGLERLATKLRRQLEASVKKRIGVMIIDSNGIVTVSDVRISAGNITDMKLINTIPNENRNTIHGIVVLFVPDSVFSALFSFANPFVLYFACLKFELIPL